MAYNLTFHMQLQAPTNIGAIAQQISRGLAGINVPVNMTPSPQSVAAMARMQQQMMAGGGGAAMGRAGTQAAASINQMGAAAARSSAQLQALAASSTRAAQAAGVLGAQAGAGVSYMQRLGAAASQATQRFVAFVAGTAAFLGVIRSFREGVVAAVDFQKQINRIAQVSGESDSALQGISVRIGELATKFGASSAELAQSSLILAQTGLTAKEVAENLETLALAAAAPNFSNMQQTAEGMIAVMRQFKTDADGTKEAIGAMNEVAAKFAVEAGDLVTATRKAGGAFSAAGGNINELIAMFTSVRSVTRESAEEIATGMRTIFARMQRADVIDELKAVGVNLRYLHEEAKAAGDLGLENQFVKPYEAVKRLSTAIREMPTTDPRFSSIIESLGGYRQISRVIPLLQQFAETEKALGVAQTGSLSLYRSAEKAQESLYMQTLKTKEEFLKLFRTLTESQGFQTFARTALTITSTLASMLGYVKPLVPLLLTMATIQIGRAVFGAVSNMASGPSAIDKMAGVQRRGFNRGGFVPGTGSGDTVEAMLEPSEFVIRKNSTQKLVKNYGEGLLHHINQTGTLPAQFENGGQVRRFENGGQVNPETAVRNYLRSVSKKYDVNLAQYDPNVGFGDVFKQYANNELGITRIGEDGRLQIGLSPERLLGTIGSNTLPPNARYTVAHELGHVADLGVRSLGLPPRGRLDLLSPMHPMIQSLAGAHRDNMLDVIGFANKNFKMDSGLPAVNAMKARYLTSPHELFADAFAFSTQGTSRRLFSQMKPLDVNLLGQMGVLPGFLAVKSQFMDETLPLLRSKFGRYEPTARFEGGGQVPPTSFGQLIKSMLLKGAIGLGSFLGGSPIDDQAEFLQRQQASQQAQLVPLQRRPMPVARANGGLLSINETFDKHNELNSVIRDYAADYTSQFSLNDKARKEEINRVMTRLQGGISKTIFVHDESVDSYEEMLKGRVADKLPALYRGYTTQKQPLIQQLSSSQWEDLVANYPDPNLQGDPEAVMSMLTRKPDASTANFVRTAHGLFDLPTRRLILGKSFDLSMFPYFGMHGINLAEGLGAAKGRRIVDPIGDIFKGFGSSIYNKFGFESATSGDLFDEILARGTGARGLYQMTPEFGRIQQALLTGVNGPFGGSSYVDIAEMNKSKVLRNRIASIDTLFNVANKARYADGGLFPAKAYPGVSPQDKVNALLTPGEWVVPADKVQKIGTPALHYMNTYGEIPPHFLNKNGERVRGYNQGGLVERFEDGGQKEKIVPPPKRLPNETPDQYMARVREYMFSEQATPYLERRAAYHLSRAGGDHGSGQFKQDLANKAWEKLLERINREPGAKGAYDPERAGFSTFVSSVMRGLVERTVSGGRRRSHRPEMETVVENGVEVTRPKKDKFDNKVYRRTAQVGELPAELTGGRDNGQAMVENRDAALALLNKLAAEPQRHVKDIKAVIKSVYAGNRKGLREFRQTNFPEGKPGGVSKIESVAEARALIVALKNQMFPEEAMKPTQAPAGPAVPPVAPPVSPAQGVPSAVPFARMPLPVLPNSFPLPIAPVPTVAPSSSEVIPPANPLIALIQQAKIKELRELKAKHPELFGDVNTAGKGVTVPVIQQMMLAKLQGQSEQGAAPSMRVLPVGGAGIRPIIPNFSPTNPTPPYADYLRSQQQTAALAALPVPLTRYPLAHYEEQRRAMGGYRSGAGVPPQGPPLPPVSPGGEFPDRNPRPTVMASGRMPTVMRSSGSATRIGSRAATSLAGRTPTALEVPAQPPFNLKSLAQSGGPNLGNFIPKDWSYSPSTHLSRVSNFDLPLLPEDDIFSGTRLSRLTGVRKTDFDLRLLPEDDILSDTRFGPPAGTSRPGEFDLELDPADDPSRPSTKVRSGSKKTAKRSGSGKTTLPPPGGPGSPGSSGTPSPRSRWDRRNWLHIQQPSVIPGSPDRIAGWDTIVPPADDGAGRRQRRQGRDLMSDYQPGGMVYTTSGTLRGAQAGTLPAQGISARQQNRLNEYAQGMNESSRSELSGVSGQARQLQRVVAEAESRFNELAERYQPGANNTLNEPLKKSLVNKIRALAVQAKRGGRTDDFNKLRADLDELRSIEKLVQVTGTPNQLGANMDQLNLTAGGAARAAALNNQAGRSARQAVPLVAQSPAMLAELKKQQDVLERMSGEGPLSGVSTPAYLLQQQRVDSLRQNYAASSSQARSLERDAAMKRAEAAAINRGLDPLRAERNQSRRQALAGVADPNDVNQTLRQRARQAGTANADPLQIKQAALRAIEAGQAGPDVLDYARANLSPVQFAQVSKAYQKMAGERVTGPLAQTGGQRGGILDLMESRALKESAPLEAALRARNGGQASFSSINRLRQQALENNEYEVKQQLISAEKRALMAINKNLSATEADTMARERVQQAINKEIAAKQAHAAAVAKAQAEGTKPPPELTPSPGMAVATDKDGRIMGLQSTVDDATARGVSLPGAEPGAGRMAWWRRFGQRVARGIGRSDQFLNEYMQKRGMNPMMMGMGLSMLAPLAGGAMVGDAETAVISGREYTHKVGSMASGALQGASYGAMIGLYSGSPTLGLAGAAVGGVIGAFAGFREAVRELAQIKLDRSVAMLADRIQVLANLGERSPIGYEMSAMGEIDEFRRNSVTLSHSQSGNLWYDSALFAAQEEKSYRQNLGPQAPGMNARLESEIGRILRNTDFEERNRKQYKDDAGEIPAATFKDRVDMVMEELMGNQLNSQFVNILAGLKKVLPEDVIQEKRVSVVNRARQIEMEEASKQARRSEQIDITSFGRLANTAAAASDSLRTLRDSSRHLADVFEMNFQGASNTSLNSDVLSRIGTGNREVFPLMEMIRNNGGADGERLYQTAAALDKARSALTSALPAAANSVTGENAEKESDFVVQLNALLQKNLGDDYKNPYIQRILNTAKTEIDQTMQGERRLQGVVEELRADASGYIKRITAPSMGPVAQFGKQFLDELLGLTRERADNLSRGRQGRDVIAQGQDVSSEMRASLLRSEAGVDAVRNFRTGDPFRNLSVDDLSSGYLSRQRRLAQEAGIGGDGLDADRFAGRYRELTPQIRRLEVARDSALISGDSDQYVKVTNQLEVFKTEAARAAQGLRSLADSSRRVQAIQEKMRPLEADRDSRFSLAQQYYGGGTEERLQIQRGIILMKQAFDSKTGLDNFVPQDQSLIVRTANSFGSSVLKGFDGAPTGTDALNQILSKSGDGRWNLAGGDRGALEQLQRDLLNAQRKAVEAQEKYVGIQEYANKEFLSGLDRQFKQFFTLLNQKFSQDKIDDLENKKTQVGGEQNRLDRLNQSRQLLARNGIGFNLQELTARGATDKQIQEAYKRSTEDVALLSAAAPIIQDLAKSKSAVGNMERSYEAAIAAIQAMPAEEANRLFTQKTTGYLQPLSGESDVPKVQANITELLRTNGLSSQAPSIVSELGPGLFNGQGVNSASNLLNLLQGRLDSLRRGGERADRGDNIYGVVNQKYSGDDNDGRFMESLSAVRDNVRRLRAQMVPEGLNPEERRRRERMFDTVVSTSGNKERTDALLKAVEDMRTTGFKNLDDSIKKTSDEFKQLERQIVALRTAMAIQNGEAPATVQEAVGNVGRNLGNVFSSLANWGNGAAQVQPPAVPPAQPQPAQPGINFSDALANGIGRAGEFINSFVPAQPEVRPQPVPPAPQPPANVLPPARRYPSIPIPNPPSFGFIPKDDDGLMNRLFRSEMQEGKSDFVNPSELSYFNSRYRFFGDSPNYAYPGGRPTVPEDTVTGRGQPYGAFKPGSLFNWHELGLWNYRASGGVISAHPGQPKGTDTVPAWLTPNEFVVNAKSSVANRELLEKINSARGPLHLAEGGLAGFSFSEAEWKSMGWTKGPNGWLPPDKNNRPRRPVYDAPEHLPNIKPGHVNLPQSDLKAMGWKQINGAWTPPDWKMDGDRFLPPPASAGNLYGLPAHLQAAADKEIKRRLDSENRRDDAGRLLDEVRLPSGNSIRNYPEKPSGAAMVTSAQDAANRDFSNSARGPRPVSALERMLAEAQMDANATRAREEMRQDIERVRELRAGRPVARPVQSPVIPPGAGQLMEAPHLQNNLQREQPELFGDKLSSLPGFGIGLSGQLSPIIASLAMGQVTGKGDFFAQPVAQPVAQPPVRNALPFDFAAVGNFINNLLQKPSQGVTSDRDDELHLRAKMDPFGPAGQKVRGDNSSAQELARKNALQRMNLLRRRQLNAQSSGSLYAFGLGRADESARIAAMERGLTGRQGAMDKAIRENYESRAADKLFNLENNRPSWFRHPGFMNSYKSRLPGLGWAFGFAEGGLVPQHLSMGGGVDDVPAWLSAGEFVIPRSTVAKYGVPAVQKFADGGLVNGTGGIQAPAGAASNLGMPPEALRAVERFGRAVDLMKSALTSFDNAAAMLKLSFNGFATAAGELAQALGSFTGKLTVSGTQKVEVVFLGADVLKTIQGDLSRMVADMVRVQMMRVFKNTFPDVQVNDN